MSDQSLIDILESLKLSAGSRKREGINVGLSIAQTVIRQHTAAPDVVERVGKAIGETLFYDYGYITSEGYEKLAKAAIAAIATAQVQSGSELNVSSEIRVLDGTDWHIVTEGDKKYVKVELAVMVDYRNKMEAMKPVIGNLIHLREQIDSIASASLRGEGVAGRLQAIVTGMDEGKYD